MTDRVTGGDVVVATSLAMTTSSRLARFRLLYDEYFGLVFSVLGQLGLHGPQREDVVQEVWLTAYRRLHTLREDASARAWLCSIARKSAWKARRTAKRSDRRIAALAQQVEAEPPDPERRFEAANTLDAALASLTDAQRRVLVLSQLHGLTAPEISDGLGVPLNTVYSRLRLARRRIDAFADRQLEVRRRLEQRDPPPQSLAHRTLAVVLPKLGSGPATAALGIAGSTWTVIKATALGISLGAAAVAVVAVMAPPKVAAPNDMAHSPDKPVLAASVGASASNIPAPRPAAEPSTEPELSTSAPLQVSPAAPRPEPTKAKAVPDPGVVDRLPAAEAEADLLRRAQEALRGGQPLVALNLLEQHRRDFAKGSLVDVRRGALVRVLCKLGRVEEAEAEARRLELDHPASAVSTAVRDGCGKSR